MPSAPHKLKFGLGMPTDIMKMVSDTWWTWLCM